MKSGIYCLKAIARQSRRYGQLYIGRSINTENRKKTHFRKLTEGSHENPKLQAYFKKYGEASLRFEVLELVGNEFLERKEAEYIAKFNSIENGFNICPNSSPPQSRIKHCRLKKFKTGEICESHSIVSFSKKYGINEKGASSLLLKQSKFYGDWCLPEESILPRKIEDPDGQVWDFWNGLEFCREKNLPYSAFMAVVNGKNKTCCGWKVPGTDTRVALKPKNLQFIDPNGILVRGESFRDLKERFPNVNFGLLWSEKIKVSGNGWRKAPAPHI